MQASARCSGRRRARAALCCRPFPSANFPQRKRKGTDRRNCRRPARPLLRTWASITDICRLWAALWRIVLGGVVVDCLGICVTAVFRYCISSRHLHAPDKCATMDPHTLRPYRQRSGGCPASRTTTVVNTIRIANAEGAHDGAFKGARTMGGVITLRSASIHASDSHVRSQFAPGDMTPILGGRERSITNKVQNVTIPSLLY